MTDERLCSTRAALLSSYELAIAMPASYAKNRCNFSDFFEPAAASCLEASQAVPRDLATVECVLEIS